MSISTEDGSTPSLAAAKNGPAEMEFIQQQKGQKAIEGIEARQPSPLTAL